ncbi:acyl-CoA reductase [Salicibibacter halophilus]|uniref:Acyl-CoA reductase n=1 Tax=Salicibibacter halophilus TaxID=2502791 RepID=A0A514LFR1_9BACI|nr:acyl-CoA reductase [Salicibibacter halophilus]QDI90698.1 acyl-CoA reductase [Salicibibacter halophilus]
MMVKGYFLPTLPQEEIETKTLAFSNNTHCAEIKVPLLSEDQLTSVLASVKTQQHAYVRKLRTNEIINRIDQAVQKWLDPSYEKRQLAEKCLPVITGYDEEMVRLFLSRYFRNFRKEQLQRFVDEDFLNPLVLDEFRPSRSGGYVRAYGPTLITHVFSGNVPVLPLWSIVSGLLVKAGGLGKVSSAEPLFPAMFAETLHEVDPEFAKALAITWWKSGEALSERAVFSKTDTVIAYGNDATISHISGQLPAQVRFHPHGHKVSTGVITRECLSTSLVWEVAHRAAKDTASFDQQGCLSPHVFYVEADGDYHPRDFARLLAHELENTEHRMPRATLTSEEASAIIRVRADAEFNKKVDLYASEQSTAWTVLYKKEQKSFPFSILNRVVTVIPIENMEDIIDNMNEIRRFFQTAGVACPPQRFHRLIEVLGACGVNRISFLGEMSQPEPGWHHDGRPNLGDLVYWCDVESSVTATMDQFDLFRD